MMVTAMVDLFLRFEHLTTRLALFGAMVMLVISVALGFYQVVTRFVIDAPSTWSEVGARSAMIWCVFLGSVAGFRGGFMMSVEVIYKLIPRRRLIWLEVLIALCCVIVLLVLIRYGLAMTLRVRSQMLSGIEISIAWVYAAMPIGASFALLAILARMLAQATGREAIGPAHDEEAAVEAAPTEEASATEGSGTTSTDQQKRTRR